ncbi:M15 family metallopeptidase [Okibacterium endophyticum]
MMQAERGTRRRRALVTGLILVGVGAVAFGASVAAAQAITGALNGPAQIADQDATGVSPGSAPADSAPVSIEQVTVDDGYIAVGDSVSPFDDAHPAIAKLTEELRLAVQRAAAAAEAQGVTFVINSGWRSARYQQALLDDAVQRYGSLDEARKWVSTPLESAHVTGDAVDVGYADADSWLSQHGAEYGLCQIYANEMWHFELATEPGGECPPQLTDSSAG